MADDLLHIRLRCNLLCHASWRRGNQTGYWHPTFINTRGERYPDDMDAAAVRTIHAATLRAARQVVAIKRETGIGGRWHGYADPDMDGS